MIAIALIVLFIAFFLNYELQQKIATTEESTENRKRERETEKLSRQLEREIEREHREELKVLQAKQELPYLLDKKRKLEKLKKLVQLEQEKTVPDGKYWAKFEKQIIQYSNQIQTVEKAIIKAESIIDNAENIWEEND